MIIKSKKLCSYVRILFIILSCFLLAATKGYAQGQKAEAFQQKTKSSLFEGMTLGVDLVGPIMYKASDSGDFQASLQANIKGKYFPAVELGYGKAQKEYDDEKVSYAAKAPFVRVGCDMNILRNKHDDYLLLVGMRYGLTSFDFDTTPLDVAEGVVPETVSEKCSLHWIELVFGVDAKVWGPLHMGWSFRYRKRMSASECQNKPLYAPGYGKADNGSQFMALYTIGIHI